MLAISADATHAAAPRNEDAWRFQVHPYVWMAGLHGHIQTAGSLPTSLQRWSTLLYRDAGGFGEGSEFTWQLLTVVNDQVRDYLFLSPGYRQLNVDYRHHVQRLNLRMSGPVLGATLRF